MKIEVNIVKFLYSNVIINFYNYYYFVEIRKLLDYIFLVFWNFMGIIMKKKKSKCFLKNFIGFLRERGKKVKIFRNE